MDRVWVGPRAESDDALKEAWNPRFPSRAATLTAQKLRKAQKARKVRKVRKVRKARKTSKL